jgi:hypothetical protein
MAGVVEKFAQGKVKGGAVCFLSGLNPIRHPELGIGIRIDFDDLHTSRAPGGNFLQHRFEYLARLTPI